MIEVVGPPPRYSKVGIFSVVDGLAHLADEIARRDAANAGQWGLVLWWLPVPGKIRTVRLHIPNAEDPVLSYFSAERNWEEELNPFELFLEMLATMNGDDQKGFARIRHSTPPGDIPRLALLGLAFSKTSAWTSSNEERYAMLAGKSIKQLAAYVVALYKENLTAEEAHAFAAKYE